jgi:hypothetical protein
VIGNSPIEETLMNRGLEQDHRSRRVRVYSSESDSLAMAVRSISTRDHSRLLCCCLFLLASQQHLRPRCDFCSICPYPASLRHERTHKFPPTVLWGFLRRKNQVRSTDSDRRHCFRHIRNVRKIHIPVSYSVFPIDHMYSLRRERPRQLIRGCHPTRRRPDWSHPPQ